MAVVLGIAMGAAVFTSVRLAVHASMDAFTRGMNAIAGKADKVVINPGGRVPEHLVRTLFIEPEIETVSPLLQTYVSPEGEEEEPILLVGIDPILDRPMRHWSTAISGGDASRAWFDLMRKPHALIVSRQLADRYGLEVNAPFTLINAAKKNEFIIVGILSSADVSLVEGGMMALVDIATFQEFSNISGWVDSIDIAFAKDVQPLDIDRITKQIAPHAVLSDPSDTNQSGRQLIRAYQLNLSVLGFASLFVGMFLVYSLITVNATARRTELAILRSLGASDNTIFWLFLAEGAFLGMVGWAIAIPGSLAAVSFMVAGISKTIATLFVRVNVTSLSLSPWELLVSFGMTMAISVTAAYMPAKQAMGVEPREVFSSPVNHMDQRSDLRKWLRGGLLCLLSILPLSFSPGIAGFPLPGYAAALLLFAGFALITPFLLKHASKKSAPLAGRFFGAAGNLALRYITHGKGTQTAVSVGALITAVALFTALVIMIHSFRQTVGLWVHQTVSGDLFVSPRLGELNQNRDLLNMAAIALIRQADSDFDAIPMRKFYLNYQMPGKSGVRFQLEATDLLKFARYGNFMWVKGDPQTAYRLAADGKGVLISEVMAARTGLGVGHLFQSVVNATPMQLPVLGIIRDYRTQGGVVFCSFSVLESQAGAKGAPASPAWSGVRLFVKDSPSDDDQGRQQKIIHLRKQLLLQSNGTLNVIQGNDLRNRILDIFDETFAVTFILLLIALLVATLGIATTMTILVLERARELNTLIAIGASPRQIRQMIFCESAFMVIAGEILGVLCGVVLSFLLIYVINAQSFGWTFLYRVNGKMIWMSLPLIFLAAFFAAIPAIRSVYRIPPATLLNEKAYG